MMTSRPPFSYSPESYVFYQQASSLPPGPRRRRGNNSLHNAFQMPLRPNALDNAQEKVCPSPAQPMHVFSVLRFFKLRQTLRYRTRTALGARSSAHNPIQIFIVDLFITLCIRMTGSIQPDIAPRLTELYGCFRPSRNSPVTDISAEEKIRTHSLIPSG
ncbi:hypothetical protein K458DRAFT_74053 [Lentithecium fluviatile CBS 122367]|uniref:Uncharacterized protein n=1 Tax=Lentithecium fluviatile CBS 122367 TaxID=1168545 RepID=A0A6G1IVZ9_9PLEO|nr:hypothetical protein K458DRAFT_74053 [Lentithecium fluviatile CBS 122367]